MASLRDTTLDLIARHDGAWGWYQLDRALTSRGLPVHALGELLRELKDQGLVEWIVLGDGPHKVMKLSDAGRRAAAEAASHREDAPLEAAFRRYGLDPAVAAQYQVLCLPENFFSSQDVQSLVEPSEAVALSKRLKNAGLSCATAYDLGLDVPSLDRRSDDLWAGVLWILDEATAQAILARLGEVLEAFFGDRKLHLELRVGPNADRLWYEGAIKTIGHLFQRQAPETAKVG